MVLLCWTPSSIADDDDDDDDDNGISYTINFESDEDARKLFSVCCKVYVHWVFAAAEYKSQSSILHCFCVCCMGGEVRKQKSVRDWPT